MYCFLAVLPESNLDDHGPLSWSSEGCRLAFPVCHVLCFCGVAHAHFINYLTSSGSEAAVFEEFKPSAAFKCIFGCFRTHDSHERAHVDIYHHHMREIDREHVDIDAGSEFT